MNTRNHLFFIVCISLFSAALDAMQTKKPVYLWGWLYTQHELAKLTQLPGTTRSGNEIAEIVMQRESQTIDTYTSIKDVQFALEKIKASKDSNITYTPHKKLLQVYVLMADNSLGNCDEEDELSEIYKLPELIDDEFHSATSELTDEDEVFSGDDCLMEVNCSTTK